MKKILLAILTLSIVFCTFQTAYSQGIELGPMLGHVSNETANIWIKVKDHTDHPSCTVKVIVSTDTVFSSTDIFHIDTVAARSQSDWRTITLKIQYLEPSTKYYYRVYIDSKPEQTKDTIYNYFKTAPKNGQNSRFKFAFTSCIGRSEIDMPLDLGGCCDVNISQQQALREAWQDLDSISNVIDFILLLGDNHYANSTDENLLIQAYTTQRGDQSSAFQQVMRHLPSYAIWDDHDFAPDIGKEEANKYSAGKERSLQVFKHYWPNPSFGISDTDGIYYKFSYGEIDFFMLDGRYNRDSSNAKDNIGKSMLGERQLKWLKNKLECSDAKIKFIACGSEWNSDYSKCPYESPINGDGWSRYMTERNSLFKHIVDEEIEGVVFVSGDRHRTTGYQFDKYQFIEISSGPFAASWHTGNKPTHESFMDQHCGNFFSVFDVSANVDPPLSLTVHRVDVANNRCRFNNQGELRWAKTYERTFSWDELKGKNVIKKLMECK